jgi:outer membrane protein insertion porin family
MDREWELSPGDPFSPTTVLQSQRNIRNLGAFNTVRFQALGFKERREEVHMVVAVEERRPYFFELGVGYVSDRGLFAATRIGDSNLFGTNREAWVEGEISEIGYWAASGIRDPHFLGSDVTANLLLFTERKKEFNQTFGTEKIGSTLGFGYKLGRRFTTGLDVKYEYRDLFDYDPSAGIPPEEVEDDAKPRNVLVFTPKVQYDSRDSFVRPRKGGFSFGHVDFSRGLENDLDNFVRYRLDARLFWTPLKRVTLAFIGRGGYIDPRNAARRVPSDQLFFLGGISDVRGFDENLLLTDAAGDPVGGREALSGSIEARIEVLGNWEVPLFVDGGWIGGLQDPTVDEAFRTSVGTGLRYHTPVGPIGILYGYKLDREEGESAGALHFSLGYTF